jgi:hypothetical protein
MTVDKASAGLHVSSDGLKIQLQHSFSVSSATLRLQLTRIMSNVNPRKASNCCFQFCKKDRNVTGPPGFGLAEPQSFDW